MWSSFYQSSSKANVQKGTRWCSYFVTHLEMFFAFFFFILHNQFALVSSELTPCFGQHLVSISSSLHFTKILLFFLLPQMSTGLNMITFKTQSQSNSTINLQCSTSFNTELLLLLQPHHIQVVFSLLISSRLISTLSAPLPSDTRSS